MVMEFIAGVCYFIWKEIGKIGFHTDPVCNLN